MKTLVLLVAGTGATLVAVASLSGSPDEAPNESARCRCVQRDLGEYFQAADEVVVGRLVASVPVNTRSTPRDEAGSEVLDLIFELSSSPYKTARAAVMRRGDTVSYRTPTTTASCGVPAQPGAAYVLFATPVANPDREGVPWHVDTCSGTRVLMPTDGSEPEGFRDVPASFVPRQLNGMAGMAVLASVAGNAPQRSSSTNEVLIGLLDVSSLSHAGFARLHEGPSAVAPVVGEVGSYDGLETREVSYETPTAVAYAVRDGWYRLRLRDGAFGWLPPDQAGTFFPYPEAVVNRLNYILAPWHGFVWPSPGAGLPNRAPETRNVREVPVEVHEVTEVGGFPFFRISVLRESPCEGGDGAVSVSGWIPAYGPDGQPSVWFHSRGC